ncbi:PDDEXK nuclease domain-containing protein [Sulfurimonas aquatica]|uniref:PDDEXK nuclease domain-containing protein n=1 Tax=Sulfurimonas aquatica TaxID=2672570 RepID=UPI001F620CF7|nr:PDDEXK nuclease domain-containing protein [Sulfurimonas aquatica]
MKNNHIESIDKTFISDLKTLISKSKLQAVNNVNNILTLMYWDIGNKINIEVLKKSRAEYGKSIVATVSRQLVLEYGRSFEEKNLRRMIQFSQTFDKEMVVTLSRELSWSHFLIMLPIKDPLKQDFYLQMSKNDRWSVRTLKERINSMLFERTAISKKPDELIKHEIGNISNGNLHTDLLLKDPYLLDFLDLKDKYLEKDLEDAILKQLEDFLLELGNGFTFVARQKRIQLDNDDFYIDLLFFNRKLKKLIAIDLKIGDFKAEYKGQMELYLRWLNKYEKQEDEGSPIGIILCTGKKEEQIELLELDKSNIHVAEYLTVLPSKEILQAKLNQAIEVSKSKLNLI